MMKYENKIEYDISQFHFRREFYSRKQKNFICLVG